MAIADGPYEIAGGGTVRRMWTTLVLEREAGVWRIAAIRNTGRRPAARPSVRNEGPRNRISTCDSSGTAAPTALPRRQRHDQEFLQVVVRSREQFLPRPDEVDATVAK